MAAMTDQQRSEPGQSTTAVKMSWGRLPSIGGWGGCLELSEPSGFSTRLQIKEDFDWICLLYSQHSALLMMQVAHLLTSFEHSPEGSTQPKERNSLPGSPTMSASSLILPKKPLPKPLGPTKMRLMLWWPICLLMLLVLSVFASWSILPLSKSSSAWKPVCLLMGAPADCPSIMERHRAELLDACCNLTTSPEEPCRWTLEEVRSRPLDRSK